MESFIGWLQVNWKCIRCILCATHRVPSRLEHIISIDKTWFNFYRQSKRDQAKGLHSLGEKSNSVVMSSTFGRKVIAVLAINIMGICRYKAFAENDTMNAVRYLGFLRRLMNCWHGNREHVVWLLNEQIIIVMLQLLLDWPKEYWSLTSTRIYSRSKSLWLKGSSCDRKDSRWVSVSHYRPTTRRMERLMVQKLRIN